MASKTPIVHIQGSILEGGGQILRMSMGFSALLGTPIRISEIRGNRSKPGLKAQHLCGLVLVKEISRGQLTGDKMNSCEITFQPSSDRLQGGKVFSADTRTAGATTLLAQVSLPCLLFCKAPTSLDLRGGTNADMAPQVDYYQQVFIPNLAKFGAKVLCSTVSKGYFPKGGGQIKIEAEPVRSQLSPVTMLDFGHITELRIEASVAGHCPVRIAEEMTSSAMKVLRDKISSPQPIVVNSKVPRATGNGSSILITAKTSTGCILGAGAIGSPKKDPSQTGEEAATEILSSLTKQACVDQYMQDQLIIYMALAAGVSNIRTGALTLHTKTAIHISQTLSKAVFEVEESEEDGTATIKCTGVGMENAN